MTKKVYIKELDPDMIPPSTATMNNKSQGGSKIVIIGKPGTGKSTLITSLLYEKSHIFPVGVVFSGTEDSNKHYSNIFPPTFVYGGLNLDRVEDFINRQKIALEHLPNPWAVMLMDDCMDRPKDFKSELFLDIFKNGRHYKMLYILSLQYCMDVLPSIRICTDGVFILRESSLIMREKLWKNFASIVGDFKTFCYLMDQLTEDYTALYIHNTTNSNKIEDCVFWYRAKKVPDGFKFGSPYFWEHSNKRYNEKYVKSYSKRK